MPSDSQLFESELLSPFHRHHPKTGLTISCMYHCFIYMYIYIYNLLFIYFWLCWVIVVSRAISSCRQLGLLSSYSFSLQWLLLLRSAGSRACGLSSCGSQALEHRLSSCGARAYLLLIMWDPWRRQWQPTPVFLPGESQGWGSLVGCRLWGRTESDTTEAA